MPSKLVMNVDFKLHPPATILINPLSDGTINRWNFFRN